MKIKDLLGYLLVVALALVAGIWISRQLFVESFGIDQIAWLFGIGIPCLVIAAGFIMLKPTKNKWYLAFIFFNSALY